MLAHYKETHLRLTTRQGGSGQEVPNDQQLEEVLYIHTVEPLIKDTLNKGTTYIPTCSGTTFLPPKKDNLSIMYMYVY